MKERNIGICILLCFVTCGIYAIYWFISITNEVNMLADRPEDISGGLECLLTLVTCGIYGFYWAYKMGGKIDTIKRKAGIPESAASNTGFTYLLIYALSLIAIPGSIIVYSMIQDTINKTI